MVLSSIQAPPPSTSVSSNGIALERFRDFCIFQRYRTREVSGLLYLPTVSHSRGFGTSVSSNGIALERFRRREGVAPQRCSFDNL